MKFTRYSRPLNAFFTSWTLRLPAIMLRMPVKRAAGVVAIARAAARAKAWLLKEAPAERGAGVELDGHRIDPLRAGAFIAVHLLCLGVFLVGFSLAAGALALALYLSRMFFITGFYHRYFSHRSFRAGRGAQFAMAVLGATAGQRGPLWWAGHHREHHITADTAADPHSPAHCGWFYSHALWFLTKGSFAVPEHRVKDWLRVPELRQLERLDWLPFALLGVACYALGVVLNALHPEYGTSGAQMLVWGFGVSTVALYHATYTINSLCHLWGTRRFDTPDDSRNNFWLALLTLGEGWHNNHHRYPQAARQGLRWWELDITWIGLRLLAALGIVSDLKRAPASALRAQPRAEAGRA